MFMIGPSHFCYHTSNTTSFSIVWKNKFLKLFLLFNFQEKQVSKVLEMLGPGQFDETKEVLQMLSNTLSSDSRRSDFNNVLSPLHPLSTISENDDLSCMGKFHTSRGINVFIFAKIIYKNCGQSTQNGLFK